MITLHAGQFGWDYLVTNEDGRSYLIQDESDVLGFAQTFGWPGDEGQPGAMWSARDWLDNCIGDSVEDPGYFSGGES